MAALDCVRQSLDVLRAHYGLLGTVPNPEPHPKRFINTFSQALTTSDAGGFCCLAPLLIINLRDDFYLIKATAEESRGRLRCLTTMATFFVHFEPNDLPPLEGTRERLWKLERGLAKYSMDGNAFCEAFLDESATPLIFRTHNPEFLLMLH